MSPRVALAARAVALALWIVPAVATAQAAPPGTDAKAATTHFERGVTFYKAKQFADALAEFRASYAAVPSPNSHLYVARCLAANGDLAAAFTEFDTVVTEAETRALGEPKYAPTRDTARLERDELAEKIALVTFTAPGADPTATLEVGGRAVPRDRWSTPTPIKPGPTEIVLRAPSGKVVTQTVTFAAGEKRAVTVEATAAAPAPPPPTPATPPAVAEPSSRGWMKPAAFVAGGVGVAGLVMFAVGGTMANGTYSTLQTECVGPCPESRAGDVSAGKTQQTVANVGLALGIVGLASGVTLFLLAPGKPAPSAARADVVVGPGWSSVAGRF